MTTFIQGAAGALIAVILCLTISTHSKDLTMLLTLVVCTMVLLCAVNFLEPVVALMKSLQQTGGLDGQLLGVILKAVGIGLIGELVSLICIDSGNSAMGRTVEVLTAAAVLWLSIPLFQQLMALMQQITGAL